MPGWQQFYAEHKGDKFEFLSVAVDVQGAAKASKWHNVARAQFTTVVDQEAVLGTRFGVKYVPFSILIDEKGKLVRGPTPVNVGKEDDRQEISQWIETGKAPTASGGDEKGGGLTPEQLTLRLRLAYAAKLQAGGDVQGALAQLKAARSLDQDNWLIRKQIWALEHPDRFYNGRVDFDWQREQLRREADEKRKAAREQRDNNKRDNEPREEVDDL